jgi:hypothetical protein
MIETIIMSIVIAVVLLLMRARWPLVARGWRAARWWERLLLILALAPIPGPVDELLGLAVLRRIVRRST